MFDYFGNQLDPSLYYARTGKYFSDFNLTALQISSGQEITLRGQEQYFAIMRLMSTQTGPFRISIYTSTSERYQYNSLTGGHHRPRPLGVLLRHGAAAGRPPRAAVPEGEVTRPGP